MKWFSIELLIGVAVAALAWWCGADVPPAVYDDVAAAAGLRPPIHILPGLWRSLAAPLFSLCGLDLGLRALCALGPAALGVSAMLAAGVFRSLLPAGVAALAGRTAWGRRVVAAVVMQGALLFAFSGPVWRTGRFLSPDALTLMVALAALRLFVRIVRRPLYQSGPTGDGALPAFAFAVLAGLLAADTPAAFLLFAALPVAYSGRLATLPDGSVVSFASPLTVLLVMRRTTRVFLAAWAAGLAAALASFIWTGGASAEGLGALQCVGHAFARYAAIAWRAATPLGWLLFLSLAVVPTLIALATAAKAADSERFMPYRLGLLFGCIGMWSFLQCAGDPSCGFWRWGGGCVSSAFLQCLAVLILSLSATVALCVLGADLYFRNKWRIAQAHYPDSVEDDPVAAHMVARLRLLGRVWRWLFIAEPLLAAAFLASAPLRSAATVRGMEDAVNDCARMTAAECGDARLVVTDGALDAAVEVCAARQGRNLKTLSLMSGGAPREVHIRQRAALDGEDRAMLATGAYETLRTWLAEKPQAMTNVAAQLGFELWRHLGRPLPAIGGLVAYGNGRGDLPDSPATAALSKRPYQSGALVGRIAPNPPDSCPGGALRATRPTSPGGALRATRPTIASARALAERMIALCARGAPGVADARLMEMFEFAMWRLSRMARARADAADRRGVPGLALHETTLADRLDSCNEAYKRIERGLSWLGRRQGQRLTPREGLAFALARADFRMAHAFARQVMLSEPDNLQANFAAGMDYLAEEAFGRAEHHFRKVLAANPKEPAALNNLAVALLRQGRTAEAGTNAALALALHPASPEIKATVEEIRRSTKLEGDGNEER